MTFYFLTRKSRNAKTGPIPVSTTSADTCPNDCPFRGNGCYAEGYPLKGRWDEVTRGERGGSLEDLAANIKTLPQGQLWRHNQAGDLPGNGHLINSRALHKIVAANYHAKARGFTFTHYNASIPTNRNAIKRANAFGFTVNLSANNLKHADELAALDIGPVAVVLPADHIGGMTTPEGRKVAQCPATYKNTTCADCGLCAAQNRKVIVGFPAHGNGKRKAGNVAEAAA